MDTLYTLDADAMRANASRKAVGLTKIASFPIQPVGWSLRSGDSIVFPEQPTPDTVFSIIDVSNPQNPRFSGLGAIRPLFGLIGKAFTTGRDLFQGMEGGVAYLRWYQYQSGVLRLMDTIGRTSAGTHMIYDPCVSLGDSTLIVPSMFGTGCKLVGCCVYDSFCLDRVTYKQNKLSLANSNLIFDYYTSRICANQYGSAGYWYNGTMVLEGSPNMAVDFNFPGLPNHSVFLTGTAQLPCFADGILIDSLTIADAFFGVFIDSVRNLVFVLSDSDLTVWTCQIQVKTVQPITRAGLPSPFMRIGSSAGAIIILLPHHTQPAEVSVYDISGRRMASLKGILEEKAVWHHPVGSGLFVVRATVDGKSYSEKVVLTR